MLEEHSKEEAQNKNAFAQQKDPIFLSKMGRLKVCFHVCKSGR